MKLENKSGIVPSQNAIIRAANLLGQEAQSSHYLSRVQYKLGLEDIGLQLLNQAHDFEQVQKLLSGLIVTQPKQKKGKQ